MAKRNIHRQPNRVKGYKGFGIFKFIVIPCCMVIVASGIYLAYYTNGQNSTYRNIEYIRSFMSSSGQLNDYSNKLGMHDPDEDIKWYKTKDEIEIQFGRIIMSWEVEDFYNKDNLTALESIGFTTKIIEGKDNVKTLHLYYMGEEVERWVK